MTKSMRAKFQQKFAAIHTSVHSRFYQQPQIYNRATFKYNRSAALVEWRQLAA